VWITVSVLVVTCPCALSLATPVALTVATGELARRGLVVTRGHAIETLARASDVVLDKTGTLTHGELRLARAAALGATAIARCRVIAHALEGASEHPIARAILHAAETSTDAAPTATDRENYPGRGVAGTIEGTRYRLGNRSFCAEIALTAEPTDEGGSGPDTVVYLAARGAWLARFELSDTLKPGAAELVRVLEQMGKRVHLLSGDGTGAVDAAASRLGIGTAVAGADPAVKQDYVAALQRAGAVVAMIGDGINDAPVLAQADVSIALGTGADLAQAQADAVVISGDPAALAAAIRLAQRTMAVVRQNLVWASVYNVVAVPAAALGYVTPWIAGLGMSASSLAVVLNALRLRGQARPEAAATRGA
jgi:Cu2+-exporting ATPase